MSVVALAPDYRGEILDRVENYRGQMLLAVGWDRHLCYSPLCFPVSPDLPFRALTGEILPGLYSAHPDAARIDWSRAEWLHGGKPFRPDPEKTLAEQGIGHKSALRFRTPGLDGYQGSGT